MRINVVFRRWLFFIWIFIIIGAIVTPSVLSLTILLDNYKNNIDNLSGNILFAPIQSKITYLMDNNGVVIHTWSSSYAPGESVYMLNDGTILRTIKLSLSAGGAGGGVQKISWDGTLLWDFRYYTNDYLSHHDIEPLPNGNVLMIAWEYKTRNEAIIEGRDPNNILGNQFNPDHIIEVKPTGPTSGDIVWEWHVWDHLIQDFDPSKDNYGVVGDHPELIDINFGPSGDWLHINSIDYNAEFDQILLSAHNFNEIWVIDHSTTTEEAAGHTGGNSGKGGDLLYRWGNPKAYRAGSTNNQKFFAQHDARWIESGFPGEGNILVFNNGNGRPGLDYSSIDEIEPPIDDIGNYYLEPGKSYGPKKQIWIYNTDFHALLFSGALRQPSGNTIICNGPAGEFLEVTPEKEIVWEYVNRYPNPFQNNVFKIECYYNDGPPPPEEPDLDCEGSLKWVNIPTGDTVIGNFQVQNIGGNISLLNWKIESHPDWGTWTFSPESGENLTPKDGSLTIEVSVVSPNIEDSEFEGYITIENQDDPEDFDIIPVYLKTLRKKTCNIKFLDYIKNHFQIYRLLYILLERF